MTLTQNLQARNLNVVKSSSDFAMIGISLARRSVLRSVPPAWTRRWERRGIPWEARGIQGLAFPGGACQAPSTRPASGDRGTSGRDPELVARLHPSAGHDSPGLDMPRHGVKQSAANEHASSLAHLRRDPGLA